MMPIAPNDPFEIDSNEHEAALDIAQLASFGDALMDEAAPPQPPRTETEATMLHVQRTLARPTDSTPIPPAIKASIQEAIMQQLPLSPAPSLPLPISVPQAIASPDRWRSRSLPPRRRNWSATASLSVMIALVIGLIGVLVAMRFDAPGPNPPTASLGQTIPNPTYPALPETCVPNGEPITSNDDVKGKSLSDWPKPIYSQAKPVTYEQGLAIQKTYLNFLRCQNEAYPASPVSTNTQFTPNSLSYYSDRMRYIIAAAQGESTIPAELQEYECEPRDQEILSSFPLPVNQSWDLATGTPDPDGTINTYLYVFSPSDVYYMADGRYGAIIGQVSTAALRNPDVLTHNDYLQFIAFKKVGDRYLIDESTVVLSPDLEHPIVEHGEGTPIPTEATFPRAMDPACLAL